jgi:predicted dienelactone hydrolase
VLSSLHINNSQYLLYFSGSKEERAFQTAGMNRRSSDLITLMDFLLSADLLGECFPSLRGRIDKERVSLWGHSYGGGSVSTVCCRDDRVKSAG